MFLPGMMRPLPTVSRLTDPEAHRIAGAPLSLVRGPPGSYVAEWLAAAIQGWGRWPCCVWLRPGNIESIAITESLVSACLNRWADDLLVPSASTPSLEATLRQAPDGAVVVLEFQGRVTPGLSRLLRSIRRCTADRDVNLIVVTESHWPGVLFGGPDCVVSTAAFSEPSMVAEAVELPAWCSPRLDKLAGRRVAVRHDVLDAAAGWPVDAIADALVTSGRCRTLLDQLTANLLDLASPAQRGALATCLATRYWHPDLATGELRVSELRPWVVPLEGQRGWLRPIWARSLRRHLSSRADRRSRFPPPQAVAGGPAPATEPAPPQGGMVEARLLGTFELSVDRRTVARTPTAC